MHSRRPAPLNKNALCWQMAPSMDRQAYARCQQRECSTTSSLEEARRWLTGQQRKPRAVPEGCIVVIHCQRETGQEGIEGPLDVDEARELGAQV